MSRVGRSAPTTAIGGPGRDVARFGRRACERRRCRGACGRGSGPARTRSVWHQSDSALAPVPSLAVTNALRKERELDMLRVREIILLLGSALAACGGPEELNPGAEQSSAESALMAYPNGGPGEVTCEVVSVGQWYCTLDGKGYYCDTKNPDPKNMNKNCRAELGTRPTRTPVSTPVAPGSDLFQAP
jgi:hypothetical protein